MKMEFLAGVSFRDDLGLLIWQPRGILDEPHVEKIIAMLEQAEDEAEKPFNRYTDLSKLTQVDLSLDYVFKVSLYRRAVSGSRHRIHHRDTGKCRCWKLRETPLARCEKTAAARREFFARLERCPRHR